MCTVNSLQFRLCNECEKRNSSFMWTPNNVCWRFGRDCLWPQMACPEAKQYWFNTSANYWHSVTIHRGRKRNRLYKRDVIGLGEFYLAWCLLCVKPLLHRASVQTTHLPQQLDKVDCPVEFLPRVGSIEEALLFIFTLKVAVFAHCAILFT